MPRKKQTRGYWWRAELKDYTPPHTKGERHERELGRCERAYNAGNELFLYVALDYCVKNRFVAPLPGLSSPTSELNPPLWVLRACMERERAFLKGDYKRTKEWSRRFKQDMQDMARAEEVIACIDPEFYNRENDFNLSWNEAYEIAAFLLDDSPDAVKKSYLKVKKVSQQPDRYRYTLPAQKIMQDFVPRPPKLNMKKWEKILVVLKTNPQSLERLEKIREITKPE